MRIPGFALGNSPLEMTPEAVRGKTLVITTTNGTEALLAAQGAAAVYLAAAVNLGVAGGAGARDVCGGDGDLLVVCAGREGGFALDDAYCAGRLVAAALGGRRATAGLNDAALASLDLVRRYGERWERPLRLSARGPRAHGGSGSGTTSSTRARSPTPIPCSRSSTSAE